MTTPFERTRAILETKHFLELLLDAVQTPGVPQGVREYARKLLRHYPDSGSIRLAHLALPNSFGAPSIQQVPSPMTTSGEHRTK